MKKLDLEKRGATAIEWALIATLVTVVLAGFWINFSNTFERTDSPASVALPK